MTIADKTEQLLKCTLQNNVQFVLNDKIIREGKMVIYHVKDFYITFNFINPKGIDKVYEIPVPFDIVKQDNVLVFSYEVDKAINSDFTCNFLIKQIIGKVKKKNKLINNKLLVKCEH